MMTALFSYAVFSFNIPLTVTKLLSHLLASSAPWMIYDDDDDDYEALLGLLLDYSS